MADTGSYCGHCGKDAARRCGQCKDIWYCTIECQQADWQFHKLLCKQVEKFKDKPNADVRRAILLPKDDDKPLLVWLPIEHEDGEDDEYVSEASLEFSEELGVPSHDWKLGFVTPTVDNGILGSDNPKEEYVSLACGKRGGGESLDHSIGMMLRGDRFECAPNQCLAHLAGDVASHFRGPIVLLREAKVEHPTFIFDISVSDFTLAIDGLLDQFNNIDRINKDVTGPHPRKKVLGVKVSQNPQLFEEIEIPKRHPVFKNGTLCAVTDFNKHPVRMHKYPAGMAAPTPDLVNDKQSDISRNALGLVVDPSSPNFAKTPANFPSHPEAILLACADGKPLSISKLSAICDFIVKKLQPILLKAPPDCRAELIEKCKVMWAGMLEGLSAARVKPCTKGPWAEGDCGCC